MVQDKKLENKGFFMPSDIWFREELDYVEAVVLMDVLDITNRGYEYFKSNSALAKLCKCSVAKVTKAISHLVEMEYLYFAKFDGRKRYLKANLSLLRSTSPTLTKEEAPSVSVGSDSDNMGGSLLYGERQTPTEPILDKQLDNQLENNLDTSILTNTSSDENEIFAHSCPESDEVIDVEIIDETPQVEEAQKDDCAQGDFQLEQEVVHVKPKTAERRKYSDEFEAFWKAYPVRRNKKALAYAQWKKTIKTVSIETIMQGLENVKRGSVEYMPEPMRWLRDERWEDEPDYSNLMKNPALQREQQNQYMANYIRQNAATLEAFDPWQ